MTAVKKIVHRLFSCECMVKPSERRGWLPPTRDAYRIVLGLAWPAIVESVLIYLAASIDTMMVGGIGHEAIAAVGITTQPRFIILSMIFSLNVGVTAVVARRRGSDDWLGANRCLRQTLMISVALSILLSAAGAVFAQPLMVLAGAEPQVMDMAVGYFQITMIGNVFSSISLTINAAQRGVGNTRVSMRTNLTANIINLIFNYLLINGVLFFPKWGVYGAAAATSLGNLIAMLMSFRSILRPDGFLTLRQKRGRVPWRFDKKTMKSVMNVMASAMVEQVFMRVGFFINAIMVARLGTIAFATHQICMNINNIAFGFGDGFSIAASSLMGQGLGAKRPDQSKLYVSVCQRLGFLFSAGMLVLFLCTNQLIVRLFTNEADIIAVGGVIVIILACVACPMTAQVIITGSLRGAGDTKYVAVMSLVCIGLERPFLTWLLCFPMGWGVVGAWMAMLFDQVIRLVFCFVRFKSGKWSKIEL